MFTSAGELLAYSNEFLDSISTPPSTPEESRERREKIKYLMEEMRRFGFEVPRFSIKDIMKNLVVEDKEQLIEMLPSIRNMIYHFSSRKWIYQRAYIAYLAEKLGELLLSKDYMMEFFKSIPFGGTYMLPVERYGGMAFYTYNTLLLELKTAKYLSPSLKVKWIRNGAVLSSTAVLLSSIIVDSTGRIAVEYIKNRERELVDNYYEVVRYVSVVQKYDLRKIYENEELMIKLLNELEEEGFIDEEGSIREDVLNGLRKIYGFR